jgi:hypothetical protein
VEKKGGVKRKNLEVIFQLRSRPIRTLVDDLLVASKVESFDAS